MSQKIAIIIVWCMQTLIETLNSWFMILYRLELIRYIQICIITLTADTFSVFVNKYVVPFHSIIS